MDKLLVTGGTGFIGYWLYQQHSPRFEITWLNHATYAKGGWEECGYNYIIHLAPVEVDKVLSLAEKCRAKLLYASSGCVHDQEPDANAWQKKNNERHIFASDADWCIARIYTVCGARLNWQRFAIGRFIEQAVDGRPLTVRNGGMSVRTYMYGSDLARWLWRMLLDGAGIYDVGATHKISIYELAEIVSELIPPHPPLFDDGDNHPDPRPHYVPDTHRARTDLDLCIEVPLKEAIRKTIADYRIEKGG